MSNYIQSDSSSFPTLRIDLQTYEESQDLAVGTCTLLRHFSSRIQSDFIVLPCDFVPPPALSLTQLLNKFRTETTYDGSIATACFFEASRADKSTVTEEWGILPTNVPIVFDERSGTLLHIDTSDAADKNNEEFELRMSLLSKSVLDWLPRHTLLISFYSRFASSGTHGRSFRRASGTLMSISAKGQFWTLSQRSRTLIPSVMSLSPGCANRSINEVGERSREKVRVPVQQYYETADDIHLSKF